MTKFAKSQTSVVYSSILAEMRMVKIAQARGCVTDLTKKVPGNNLNIFLKINAARFPPCKVSQMRLLVSFSNAVLNLASFFLGEYVPLSLLVYDDIVSGCIRL